MRRRECKTSQKNEYKLQFVLAFLFVDTFEKLTKSNNECFCSCLMSECLFRHIFGNSITPAISLTNLDSYLQKITTPGVFESPEREITGWESGRNWMHCNMLWSSALFTKKTKHESSITFCAHIRSARATSVISLERSFYQLSFWRILGSFIERQFWKKPDCITYLSLANWGFWNVFWALFRHQK